MKINDIKNEDYEYWGQWKQPVLSNWFWMKWNESDSFKEININKITLHPLIYLDGHFFIDKNERNEFKKICEKLLKNNKTQKFIVFIEKIYIKYEKKYLKILELPKKDNDFYLRKLYKESSNIAVLWLWGYFLTEEFGKLLVERNIINSERDLLDKAAPLMKKTWLEKQILEINQFANDFKSLGLSKINLSVLEKHPKIYKKINNHIKEFDWFETHHWMGEGYNISKCIDQINYAINSPEDKKEKKVIKNENAFIDIIALGMYWRTHFAELTAKVAFKSRDILNKKGKLVNVNYDDLVYLGGEEILSLNKNSNREYLLKNITDRKKGYGLFVDNSKINIITGNEFKSLFSKMLNKKDLKDILEIIGNVASRGEKVRGIAKIIISPADFSKFMNNDILITSETAPDFVPLMKKSLAIITDTGGITSHAAIVSRELGKPCIIGTKIATQVLHDGDFIEVDTDKGVIKIIEMAK